MPKHAFSGAAVQARRQELDLPREAVAVAIGRSLASVVLYESNRVDPPASIIAALADALGAEPGDFFVGVQP